VGQEPTRGKVCERRSQVAVWALLSLALIATPIPTVPAQADVLAVGDDGTITVHSGPALYTSPDLQPKPIPSETFSTLSTQRRRGFSGASDPDVRSAIASAASRYAISSLFVSAVAWRESDFNVTALSPKGARGVMQLMPATARELCAGKCSPRENVSAGAAYLAKLLDRYHGDIERALAAYNAGPHAVDRFGGVPPYRETQNFVNAILERLSSVALAGSN